MEGKLKYMSFNCQGFKTRMHDYVKEKFEIYDVLLLQETWLYNFEHNLFKKILPDCQYHAVSAMDETKLPRIGRPEGGCAVLWKKNLEVSVMPINTNSPRLCAVTMKSETIKLLIISVYMPTDDNSNDNYEEYGDVLYEISSILNQYDEYDIVIGGDLNVDFSRNNSRNLTLFKQFLHLEDLECRTLDIVNGNFTRVVKNSKSFLDHFILSKNIDYSNVEVLDEGYNLSDHNPVTIQTKHEVRNTKPSPCQHRIIKWENATEDNIKDYRDLLDYYLTLYDLPLSVINCNNFLCKCHNDIIIEKVDEIIEIMTLCAELTIPIQNVTTNVNNNGKRGIPGWNDFVKPYKDKSIFWNELWVSAGKPTSGILFDLRRFARSKYHWAIKQVKKNKDTIVLNKTAQQLANKSYRDFWKTIKKLKGSERVTAKVIDDNYTDETIVNNFRNIYSTLYNSVDDRKINDTKLKIENLVENKCNKKLCNSNCHKVSSEQIKNAIKCLNNGKDDETYNIYSDNFLHATDLTHNILSQLVTAMLIHGTASELINKSIIKPIPKNKQKSLSDSKNYRAISKNSIISKIIDHVLINLIGEKMNTTDYQFAYKAGFSTSLCSFLVAETISYYRSRGSNVYMLSLDASKAFDRVQYSKMFDKLISKDVCPLIIRFILNSYLISKSLVKWNKTQSEPFSINNGVKQGAVLSAPLFALYVDDLLIKLNNSKQGCHIGYMSANAFGYADDIVILSPTCKALKFLIAICEEYASEHKIQFNPDKCTLLIFSDSDFYHNNVNIVISGCKIKNVKQEKHLGHTFQNSRNIINFDAVIKDIKVRSNIIVNQFRPISWQSKATLFMSQCSSLYGCHLWNLDDNKISELNTAWNVSCRKVLNLDSRTRTYLISPLMNSMPIEDIIMHRMLSFFLNGLKHKSIMISFLFTNVLTSKSSDMLRNINTILQKANIKYEELFHINKVMVKNRLKERATQPDWRTNIVKELLDIRDGQLNCGLDHNEVNMMLKHLSTFR